MTDAGTWQPDPLGAASWRWWDGTSWGSQTALGFEKGLAPMSQAVGQSLQLAQTAFADTHQLCLGETAVGLMDKPFVGESSGHAAEGSWLFDRKGLTQNHLSIRVLPANAEIATFAWEGIGTGTNGQLTFPDGRLFVLCKTEEIELHLVGPPLDQDRTPMAGGWAFLRHDGVPLVSSRIEAPPPKTKKIFGKTVTYSSYSSGGGKTAGDVWTDVHAEASGTPELPLLVLLGAYLAWWTAIVRQEVHM